jgi:hypothetical protein
METQENHQETTAADAAMETGVIAMETTAADPAKTSEQGIDFLYSGLSNLVEPLQKITPTMRVDKQEECETFLGNKIPNEVVIHPPNDIKSKGRCKRIKKGKEKKAGSGGQSKNKRKCGKCKQVADHDARNCPNNVVG